MNSSKLKIRDTTLTSQDKVEKLELLDIDLDMVAIGPRRLFVSQLYKHLGAEGNLKDLENDVLGFVQPVRRKLSQRRGLVVEKH
jgi:hypothetical protein